MPKNDDIFADSESEDVKKQKVDSSKVDHPKHYNVGEIEVIDAIEDWDLNFSRGNAIKYIARAGRKDPESEIEDLEKAVWYIEREILRIKK
jgi:CRISPR/Cas system-associated protein Cas5 (RAMP superfamily)